MQVHIHVDWYMHWQSISTTICENICQSWFFFKLFHCHDETLFIRIELQVIADSVYYILSIYSLQI